MILHFDGGLRPGIQGRAVPDMEIAVVTGGRSFVREALGAGDSCTAEWLALRYAVAIAAGSGAHDVLFVGDSCTVIEQALGRWRCRSPQLQPHLDAYCAAVAGFARVHLRHVPRSKNLAGIALARRHDR